MVDKNNASLVTHVPKDIQLRFENLIALEGHDKSSKLRQFVIEYVDQKEAEFDQNVQALDDKYGDKIKFKYVGTLPPFNFVNLVIETGKY